jgi:hypothetical protein
MHSTIFNEPLATITSPRTEHAKKRRKAKCHHIFGETWAVRIIFRISEQIIFTVVVNALTDKDKIV